MPTTHVQSTSSALLQQVADSLLKARKVVVVTGAGISTNSGIPDFRSENGLYSLIQTQFEIAAKQATEKRDAKEGEDEVQTDYQDDSGIEVERAVKRQRRRLQDDASSRANDVVAEKDTHRQRDDEEDEMSMLPSNPPLPEAKPVMSAACTTTPRRTRHPLSSVQLMTSPLSSPPPDDQLVPPSAFRFTGRLADFHLHPSSSPLSSPPSVLFEPYQPSSPPDHGSTSCEQSDSELEELPAARKLFPSSQGSGGTSRSGGSSSNVLPNMKGKDLFDVSVWADPIRTSVFYTFATSLRQRSKDAEPTGSHRFISQLRNRGKLVRCYTQNIDQIEEKVGLSTTLTDGPGRRGRFSRRSTANKEQLAQMAEGAPSRELASEKSQSSAHELLASQESQASSTGEMVVSSSQTDVDVKTVVPPTLKKEPSQSGVECVFLHGSLELLRCFLCRQVCSWDEDERETATLTGKQPECPRCAGAAAAREEKGKRSLGVGKLRPDIVLYGEEHPYAHLISPIVTHDLSLCPDMLLILGTSLRVHGLKVMVREFAKTVHNSKGGGKVVFVNLTKPPESSWGEIIDFWVEWDCDAWVEDLRVRVPGLWRDPSPKRPKGAATAAAANPAAMRDSKVTGAYCTLNILKELRRITSTETSPAATETLDSNDGVTIVASNNNQDVISAEDSTTLPELSANTVAVESPTTSPVVKVPRPKIKGARKSAPGALDRCKNRSSTLNPNHGRSRKSGDVSDEDLRLPRYQQLLRPPVSCSDDGAAEKRSVANSTEPKPRVGKRKTIGGGDTCEEMFGLGMTMTLPPLRPGAEKSSSSLGLEKLRPMEPKSRPAGPLASLSSNMRSVRAGRGQEVGDGLGRMLKSSSCGIGVRQVEVGKGTESAHRGGETVHVVAQRDGVTLPTTGVSSVLAMAMEKVEDELRSWGSNWQL